MPYNINKFNGTVAVVVEDGTVDSTFDIKLIGKNYAGYGEVQNENYLHLLENFANSSEPPRKTTGQIWYDSANKKLKFYDGLKFRTTGGAEVGAIAPTGLTEGDFWFNTSTNQLFAWEGAEFILVGPQAVADADTTQLRSRSVIDNTGASHAIIEALVNGNPVYIISPDEFTIDSAINEIVGFSVVKKGLTLKDTNGTTGVTSSDYRYWGTASNSLKLGGVDATNFVRKDESSYPTVVQRFADVGYTVGNDNDLEVYINGTVPTIKNALSDSIVFQTTSSGTKTPLVLSGSNILPGLDNTSNIGSSTLRYASVYATSFQGTASSASQVTVEGTPRTATLGANIGTPSIAARDSAGDLTANIFRGTAQEALYADLAEKYLADAEYEVGTVVAVGGDKEVTATVWGDRAIGVVSQNPAFKMNSELEGGTYIALKGRVPVKVTGAVKKGQRLIASNNGTATAAVPHANDVFAIALESNDDSGTKLVEAVIL